MQDPLTGQLYQEAEGSVIHEDTGNVPYLFAPLTQSVTASTVVVAGVTGKKIRVLGVVLTVLTAGQTVTFQTQTGPVALTGAMTFAANEALALLPPVPHGLFETLSGDGLFLALGGATLVSGFLIYCLH
jgi:hypothetical protein